MIIIPIRSAESLRAEAEWLSRQPRWVQRAYVTFYGAIAVATVLIVLWGAWISYGA